MTARHRVLLATAALILASIIQLALTASVARNREAAFVELKAANTRTALVAEVSRLVTAMQAAQRGYLLTGASEFKQNYQAAHVTLHERIEQLDARAIDAAVEDWDRNVSAPLFAKVEAEGPGGSDLSDVILREGLPRLKAIEATVESFTATQDAATSEIVDRALGSIERGMLILLALPFVSVGILIFLASYLYRQVLRPIRHFTEASARISAGDYAMPVPINSSEDELAKFGRAFDAMRRDVAVREEALQSERERLGLVVDSAPVALVLYDGNGRVFLQNALADRLFGPNAAPPAQAERFGGQPLDPTQWPPLRALAGESVSGDEVIFSTPDGQRVPVIASAVPLRDPAGHLTGAVAAFQDVSQRFELDRVKDDFVSVVSHELRTPMTSLRGSLQLALDPGTDADERTALLRIALANTDRLVRMVNDVLDVAKIKAGKLTLQRTPATLEPVLTAAIDSVRGLASQAGVRLELATDPDLPPLPIDSDRIIRAIVNLLSNAIKFSPTGGVVHIRAAATPDTIDVSVTDQGPGIPAEKLPLLFERFQQLENIDIRRNQGTGLGLAITKGIVLAHGGRIDVHSVLGDTTRFTIILPRVAPAEVDAHLTPGQIIGHE